MEYLISWARWLSFLFFFFCFPPSVCGLVLVCFVWLFPSRFSCESREKQQQELLGSCGLAQCLGTREFWWLCSALGTHCHQVTQLLAPI